MNIRSAKELVSAANADVETLSADDAVKLMDDPAVAFVDVRKTDERRKTGSLKGAVHAPRGFIEFYADPGNPIHLKALSSGKRPGRQHRLGVLADMLPTDDVIGAKIRAFEICLHPPPLFATQLRKAGSSLRG